MAGVENSPTDANVISSFFCVTTMTTMTTSSSSSHRSLISSPFVSSPSIPPKESSQNMSSHLRPINLPMIPPLPSSVDKENKRSVGDGTFQGTTPQQPSSLLQTRSNLTVSKLPELKSFKQSCHLPTRPSPTVDKEQQQQRVPGSTSPLFSISNNNSCLSTKLFRPQYSTTLQPQPRRILHYGETIESLFGTIDETYRELCESIVSGPAADDPTVWSRVLERATTFQTTSRGTFRTLVIFYSL